MYFRYFGAVGALLCVSASAVHGDTLPFDHSIKLDFDHLESQPVYSIEAFEHAELSDAYVHITSRADAHAPIGVMGDHAHKIGELMLSYRYMRMEMDGNRDGDSSVSTSDVLADFMVSPIEMTMEMHMLGAMYAPTDWMTLMAMVPYVRKDMRHVTRMGGRFTTSAEGLGDIKLTAMFPVCHEQRHSLQLNVGLSLPTGSIDEKDATPADPGAMRHLPYPMQLGSGTWDLLPAAVYTYQSDQWSAGASAMGTIRLGRNSNDYSLGDRLELSGWWAYRWADWCSTSVRLNYQVWGNIDGADSDLNPLMVPTADPNRRGGQRLDVLFGVNLYAPDGALAGHRLAVEVGFPVYQNLDGPQLETDLLLTIGWQYSF